MDSVVTSNIGILLSFFIFSLNPVVSFPFNRGPYPRYDQGVDLEDAIDDSADARAMAKDFLVYIGAFAEEELDVYEVTFTEGAESGMTHIWAGKVSSLFFLLTLENLESNTFVFFE